MKNGLLLVNLEICRKNTGKYKKKKKERKKEKKTLENFCQSEKVGSRGIKRFSLHFCQLRCFSQLFGMFPYLNYLGAKTSRYKYVKI